VPPAQVPRRPVKLAQAVQNRSLDAVLGVAVEDHLLVRIVLAGGIEQSQNAGVDQVIQIHVHGEILMHSHRNGLYQGQMVENDSIP